MAAASVAVAAIVVDNDKDAIPEKTSRSSDEAWLGSDDDSKPEIDNYSSLDGHRLLERSELPEWQKEDSPFIETSYRQISGSVVTSLKSLAYLHNETVNIYSHLVGSVLFFVLPIAFFINILPRHGGASTAEVLVFSAFFFGVAICFAFSAIYHIILNHSEEVACFTLGLDLQGIVILMWGATMPTIYYALTCSPRLQTVYWILVSCLALVCSVATFTPLLRGKAGQLLRATMYSAFGASTLVPIFHSIALYGLSTQNYRASLLYLLGTAILNLAGAGMYAARMPERRWRRKFDLFGSSHQIMHVAVMFAAIVHLFGLLRDFDHLHHNPIAC